MSKEDINELPLRRYEGDIRLIRNGDGLEEAVAHLRAEPLLGFDTETKPTFRKGESHPPALLQLACADCVYLFQLQRTGLHPGLVAVLADAGITKTGVSVWDDIKGLQGVSPFADAGFVDLGDVARALKLKTNGLRNMAANFLGFRISKSAQRSNWGRAELSADQIAYAATDAWVSRELHIRMAALRLV
ncbi:MAG: 3'-5' exonuclease [Desulfovibrionaceae bacterium]